MPGKQASRLRLRGPGLPPRRLPSPNVSQARRLLSRLALRSPFLAFRRRDACSPGCAAYPSAVARLRSVHPSSEEVTDAERFAGETPALFAEQSAFGGCLASAAYSPKSEEITDDWRFAGEDACFPGFAVFPLPGVSQARRLLSWLRSVPFGGCQAAQCSQANRKSYRRLAFRRRGRLLSQAAQRTLRRLPGCAAFTLPPRKVTDAWRFAGEDACAPG